MLVEQIDGVDLEALERALDDVCDVLRPAAELGCDHDLVAHRRQGFAHEFFVRIRPVRLGRVEEGDAALEG